MKETRQFKRPVWMEYSIFPGEFLIGFTDGTSLRFTISIVWENNHPWQVVSNG